MKEKIIITLWKAQLSTSLPNDSIYCLINYNNQSKTSKNIQNKTSLEWKQTFIFSLAKEQLSLKIDFISLKKGEEIHFAHDNVAESLSVAKAVLKVPVKAPTKGSLPAKLDIIDGENGSVLGKVFVEYEVLKTEVTYVVEKMMEYDYMLKLSNFSVTFLRGLKKLPTFYLKLTYGSKTHNEDFPFTQENGRFIYTYPIKLYMGKEIDIAIQLQVKQFFGLDYQSANQSMKSGSIITDKRSDMSSMLKKSNTVFDIGVNSKISGVLDLTFKESVKTTRKISLTTPIKNQQREIGTIEFQLETVFKTTAQKQAFEEQKRGVVTKENPEIPTLKKKKSVNAPNLQQSNGYIVLNTIMGKLQLNESDHQKINNKDLSLTLKLGKIVEQSSILSNPGKQLIFLDSFTFKRTWQQTIKIILQVHNQQGIKIPLFHASVNLRELFQMGRIHAKKVKIFDQQKQYCGTFALDMEYKEEEKKAKEKSPSLERKGSLDNLRQRQLVEKRQKITERMKQRQEEKRQKVDSSRSMSLNKQRDIITMAQALDLKDLILPPLKSRKINSDIHSEQRYVTLNPGDDTKKQKFRSANVYNSNGAIKFTRSPRFSINLENNKSGDSFSLVRESDFDKSKKKGAFIGYGDKHDFTRDVKHNPGIGKYQMPSLWDKYQ